VAGENGRNFSLTVVCKRTYTKVTGGSLFALLARPASKGARMQGGGGQLVMDTLARHDVDTIFTLSGGHIFPLYDGAVKRDVRIFDVRHEQTAAFAAEGWAKLTRKLGVAALTAGPGVTNSVSAVTTASFNGSPVMVLGGRAAASRWGMGSLQEFDHIPVMRSITKTAITAPSTEEIPGVIEAASIAASVAHRGPVFVDLPMDVLFGFADVADLSAPVIPVAMPNPEDTARVGQLLAEAKAPLLVIGSDVYWEGAWEALAHLAETAAVPVIPNGLGRGLLPADHDLAFSRARSTAFKNADLVIVAGTPLDFRLGFGKFGDAKVVHLVDHSDNVANHVEVEATAAGDLGTIFDEILSAFEKKLQRPPDRTAWLDRLRQSEQEARAADELVLQSDADPIHPARIYGELRKRLDRDAVVIGDGGDFVSYAGKYVDSYLPGHWMDPGPFGCLGTGLGYALAARVVHPDKQIFLMLGDGALGFSAMDFDTLVRFNLPVVGICGNNGIWGLEKHPMQKLYGYDVAADLQPGCRYDQVVAGLGGHGEFVTSPDEIGPAIDRALESGLPALVNVVTDPKDQYPRSSVLA